MLQSEQPVSAEELAEFYGASKTVVLKKLKLLRNFDLVCRIKFEHNTLYCTNGIYSRLFS